MTASGESYVCNITLLIPLSFTPLPYLVSRLFFLRISLNLFENETKPKTCPRPADRAGRLVEMYKTPVQGPGRLSLGICFGCFSFLIFTRTIKFPVFIISVLY